MRLQTLVSWWADYPKDLLTQRVLQPLQRYLTTELVVTKKLTVSVMNTIKVLAKIEEANQIGRKLPPEAFYNELIRYITACQCTSQVTTSAQRRTPHQLAQILDTAGFWACAAARYKEVGCATPAPHPE